MSERLGVLFLSTRAPFPPTTGHFQRTFNILTRMAASADVHFFGFFDKGLGRAERDRVRTELEKHCRSVYLETIPADESRLAMALLGLRGLVSRKPVVALKYFRGSMRRAIGKRVAESRVQIAHVDMLPLAEYGPDLGDIPVLLTNHNVESVRLARLARNQANPLWRMFLAWQARKLEAYERSVVEACRVLVAVSADDAEVLRRFNPACAVEVVPNGTDTGFYRLPKDAGPSGPLANTILWVGSAVDPYNRQAVDYFCDDVFPRILKDVPDAVFRFVGKMPDRLRENLQSRLGGNFDFRGFVDDVREHYAEAKIVCIPLLSGSGTKLKVIEALSMSRAVVTTPVGAEGLDVVDGTHLLVRDDASNLAAAVVALLRDDEQRARMESAARALAVDRYDWDRIADRQMAICRRAAAGEAV